MPDLNQATQRRHDDAALAQREHGCNVAQALAVTRRERADDVPARAREDAFDDGGLPRAKRDARKDICNDTHNVRHRRHFFFICCAVFVESFNDSVAKYRCSRHVFRLVLL